MANIYNVKDGNDYHWDDPNAWQGGVVPGPTDTAYIQHEFTRINSGSGIHHWEGTLNSIRVDSTTNFPDSGSFYTWLSPSAHKIKIDYQSKDSTYFYTCSIDQSYQAWEAGDSGSNIGIIINDASVFTKSTTIYISGSADIHAQEIIVESQAEFIIKDQATLRLDCSTRDARIIVRDGVLKMLDETTYIITGSTERNSTGVIYQQNHNYAQVLVSGSSDLRTRTTVASNTLVGTNTIPVDNTTGFEIGDVISIYDEDNTIIDATLDANNVYDPYDYENTGSIYPYVKRSLIRDQNETVEIIGKDSSNFYVKKYFGKEGEVLASTNTFTKDKFQRIHGKSKSKFTGNKTAITVRSERNDFKVGDKLAIGSGIYTVLEAADKLIPYKEIDFSQGANLDDFFVDEFVGSGSGEAYRTSHGFATGSYLSQDENVVGSSTYYKSLYLKGMKLRDVKVTLSGSNVDEDGNYDGNRMVGVSTNDDPYQRDRALAFYSRYAYSRALHNGVYGYTVYAGSNGTSQNYDTRNFSQINTTPANTHAFTVEIDTLRENVKHSYNGHELFEQVVNRPHGTVAIHLRRKGAQIHSLKIEEYVQELVLDTSNSILVGSTIHEAGTLSNHSTNQSIVKLASKVVDLRGYKDIGAEYNWGNTNPTTIPQFWSNQGNYTQYRTSNTGDSRGRTDALFKHSQYRNYFRTISGGDRYFDINFEADVTFDAIGLAHFYASTGYYPKGIGFEISNDGTNWTVIRAQADDTRLGVSSATHRIYTFSEVTAKFLRVRVNGATASSNNYINKLSIYHFDGRGSTIELNNTSDINVGDEIALVSPHGHHSIEYDYPRTNNWRASLQAGTTTEDDIPGGPTTLYTVTAKTGNIVTLDRLVETEYLTPDMHVYKMNRSLTVKGDNYLPAGLYFSDSSSALSKVEIFNASALMLGTRGLEQMYFYRQAFGPRYAVLNSSFNYIEVDYIYQRSSMEWLNCVITNSSSTNLAGSSANYDHGVVHGNLLQSHNGARFRAGSNTTITGNFFDSYRYAYLQSTVTDIFQPTKLTVKGNFIRFNDYFNIEQSTYYGENNLNIEMYSNKMSGYVGYYRAYTPSMRSWTGAGKIEWPEQYLSSVPTGYYFRTNSGLQVYKTTGTDRIEMMPVYNNPQVGYRNYLIDDGRRMIIKKHNSNEFDVIAVHLNRVGAVILGTVFESYTEQTVKLLSTIDYYTPKSGDDYNYGSSPGQDFQYVLIGPDGRLITSKVLPYQQEYGKQSFEYSFTAQPGQYMLALLKRHGGYGSKIMTYRDASCVVMGDSENHITIRTNNFTDHMILSDDSKFTGGMLQIEGSKPMKNNPQRTTVKFRKIKF